MAIILSVHFLQTEEIGFKLISEPGNTEDDANMTAHDIESSSETVQRLIAQPTEKYSFIGWTSENGESFSPDWQFHSVDSVLDDSSVITGYFQPKKIPLLVEFDPEQGSIAGWSNNVSSGSSLNLVANPLKATPLGNYLFSNWELIKEITFEVTRANSSLYQTETRLFINGEESPEITLIRGFTYNFICSLDNDDEFFISESINSSSSNEYTDGIIGGRTTSGTLTFAVPHDSPDLLFYCGSKSSHAGNRIKVISRADAELLSSAESVNPEYNRENISFSFGLKANFERESYDLNVESTTGGTANYEIKDDYYWNDIVEISAEPNLHWQFSHWEGSHIETPIQSSVISISITDNTEITPVFEPKKYAIEKISHPETYGVINFQGEKSSLNIMKRLFWQ